MASKPQRFVVYYDGVPFRRSLNHNQDNRIRYQYATLSLARKYIKEMLDDFEYKKKDNFFNCCDNAVDFFKNIDISKFEIKEFGEIATHKLQEHKE